MTSDLDIDGIRAAGGVRRGTDGELEWPTLARLMRVGFDEENAALTAFAKHAFAASSDRRMDDRKAVGDALPPEEAMSPPPREARRRIESHHRRTRFAIDPPHAATRGNDGAARSDDRRSSDAAADAAAPRREQFRIDRGMPRGPSGAPHARDAEDSFASRVFHLHAALAPHAGLVATAALILSAGLAYWLMFSRSPSAINVNEELDLQPRWSNDAASTPGAVTELSASASLPDNVGAQIDWSPAPRIADATASGPAEERTAPVPAAAATSTSPDLDQLDDQGPELKSPTLDAGPSNHAAARPLDDPIAPTQAFASYPVTSAPCFSFTSPPAPFVGVPAIAEHSSSSGGNSTTR